MIEFLFRVLALLACLNLVGADARAAACAQLFDELAALDSRLLGDTVPSAAARVRFRQMVAQVREACVEKPSSVAQQCVLEVVLGPGGLTALREASQVGSSSASVALADGKGTCAGVAAVALALTAAVQMPTLEVVVLTDHVLLVEPGPKGSLFEPLDGGRELRPEALQRYRPFPPVGPIRVDAKGFIPYYLDNLAARLAAEERHEAAERAFDEAVARGPREARIHYNYGTWLIQRERWPEADDALSRAIHHGWRDADAFVNRGVARWRLGRLRAAAKDFRKALELEPGDRRARANLASLERELQPRFPAEP